MIDATTVECDRCDKEVPKHLIHYIVRIENGEFDLEATVQPVQFENGD